MHKKLLTKRREATISPLQPEAAAAPVAETSGWQGPQIPLSPKEKGQEANSNTSSNQQQQQQTPQQQQQQVQQQPQQQQQEKRPCQESNLEHTHPVTQAHLNQIDESSTSINTIPTATPRSECTCFYRLVKLTKPTNSVRLGLDDCEFYFQRVILLLSTKPEELDLPEYENLLLNAREIYMRPKNELMYRQGRYDQLVRPHECAETDSLISFVREHHRQQMIKMGRAKTGEATLSLIREIWRRPITEEARFNLMEDALRGPVPTGDVDRSDYSCESIFTQTRPA